VIGALPSLATLAAAAAAGSRSGTLESTHVMFLAVVGLGALGVSMFLMPEKVRHWRESFRSRRAHHARQRGFRRDDELTLRERLSARFDERRGSSSGPAQPDEGTVAG
jgi:hypothetical protein